MTKARLLLLLLLALLPLSIILACSVGAVHVSAAEFLAIVATKLTGAVPSGFTQQQEAVIWLIRLPRVLMSILAGASLAICGTAVQGLFRNPLADPSIIGISAGGALAASLVIVLAGSSFMLQGGLGGYSLLSVATFAGACLSAVLIFRLAKNRRGTDVATMLLAGIAINAIAGAFTGLLTFISTDAQLRSLTFWTLGSLGGATWQQTGLLLFTTTVSLLFLLRIYKPLNALALGEQEAAHIGTPVEKVKNKVIILTPVAVGATVAFCGMIGFVGLVVPHILRLAGSYDHRFLLPASALGGAILLCLADTLCRTIVAPAEIPIGIITSLTGAPVFLFLLVKQKRKAL